MSAINRSLQNPVSGQDADTKAARDAAITAAKVYDIASFCSGAPIASQILLRMIMVRQVILPVSLTGSKATIGTNPTGALVVAFAQSGSASVTGQVSFSTSGVPTFTLASQMTLAIGDVLTFTAPASPDATGANIGITLMGTI